MPSAFPTASTKRRRRALAALTTLCALAVPATAGAAFPGTNGPIDLGANGGILTAPAGGGVLTPLTPPGNDYLPAASPDGLHIAFVRGRDIWAMNADGSGQHAVTTDGYSNTDPAWSPDGTKIVFASTIGGSYDLWSKPAAGGAATQLTKTPYNDERQPSWSPVGGKIAYQRTGCEVPHGGGICVYVMKSTGAGQTNLTPELSIPGCDDLPGYYFSGSSSDPTWSPDGKHIVFVGPLMCGVSALGSDIWTMAPDGSGKVDLIVDDATNDRSPSYSPDGTQIAFMSDRSKTGTSIYRMPSSGGSITRVTTGNDQRTPDWAPKPKACLVPDEVGKTQALASKSLTLMGCKLGLVTTQPAGSGPIGVVVSQSQPAGTKLAKGTKINVVVSQ